MTKYTIKTHKSVEKFLSTHPEVARHFIEKFSLIAQDPQTNAVDTKPLKGKPNNFRLRIGKYRFLYEIRHTEILIWIWRADNRNNVYDDL